MAILFQTKHLLADGLQIETLERDNATHNSTTSNMKTWEWCGIIWWDSFQAIRVSDMLNIFGAKVKKRVDMP